MESFFHTLTLERLHGVTFSTKNELKKVLHEYIG